MTQLSNDISLQEKAHYNLCSNNLKVTSIVSRGNVDIRHQPISVVFRSNPIGSVFSGALTLLAKLFQGSVIRKNSHFGGKYDRGYESGFTTRYLLHNFSIVRSAI